MATPAWTQMQSFIDGEHAPGRNPDVNEQKTPLMYAAEYNEDLS